MNRKLKRLVTVVLSLSMAMGLLFACGKKTEAPEKSGEAAPSNSEAPAVPEPGAPSADGKYDPMIKLTSVRAISDPMQKYIDKQSDVLTKNIWFDAYRDELGIDVSYDWTAPGAQYDEKLNQQIAAGDLPDIFRCNAAQLKQLADKGMIADLTDVFKEYASDFTREMMEAGDNIALSQATINGRLMALPNVNSAVDNTAMWWVRKDWLDKLGKKVPTNMQELEDLALAFAKEDPDGNGQDDTYGLGLNKDFTAVTGLGTIDAFAQGYHAYVGGAWLEKDGKKVYGGIQPEVKTALAALAKLYSEGAIDKEFMVKDQSKLSEDIVAGKVGLVNGMHWHAFGPMPQLITEGSKAEWLPFGVVSADEKPVKVMENSSTDGFWVVNVDCKNPEAAVKLYNYYYKKDPAVSPDFDPKFHGNADGDPENNPPGETYWWALCQTFYPRQNLFIHEGVMKYFDGDKSVLDNYWIKDNAESCEAFKKGDLTKAGSYLWSGPGGAFSVIKKYVDDGSLIVNAYMQASTDSMMKYNATLDQATVETFTKIIMGEDGVDAFDGYVENWQKLGGDKITQEVNAAQ